MVDVHWRFREMSPAEINQNPMERELFAEESLNERLVREVVQNSLDASIARVDRSTSEPVRVRFSLQGVHQPLDAIRASEYLDGLDEHLKEGLDRDDDFRRLTTLRGLADKEMQYLVVEDAGTVGLEGDWRQYDDSEEEPADNNHFYWFFRNIGRSGKGDEDGGSWGLGKWVFPDASHASAYIAVTRRRSDGETLLMGQSVLTKHTIEGHRYAPYGFFAEEDEQGLPVPLRMSESAHRSFVEQCIADFGLRFREEPGLSVIVPFPRVDEEEQISREQVLHAVTHNYFYAIIAGRLKVIVDEGEDTEPVEVNADTIDEVLTRLPLESSGERSQESYRRLFEMCRTALDPAYRHMELSTPPRNAQGYTHRAELAELRSRYDSGELLAFRVGMTVERKNEPKRKTSFRLYVQHDDSLPRGHDYYVRGMLSIPEKDFLGHRPARTLLIVDEQEPLAAMLRDSEPPAHTSWRPQDERVGKRWVAPYRRIKQVREAPLALLSIWEATPVGLQKDALADIFPAGGGPRPRRSRDGAPPEGPIPIHPDPPSHHPDFDLHQVNGGFGLRLASGVEKPPSRVRLRAAYEVPRGNAMTSYNPHDFRLHGGRALDVTVEGCRIVNGEKGNELLLEIDSPALFFVTVRGFDARRDLLVDVQRTDDGRSGGGGASDDT